MKEIISEVFNDHLKSTGFQAGITLVKVELLVPANELLN